MGEKERKIVGKLDPSVFWHLYSASCHIFLFSMFSGHFTEQLPTSTCLEGHVNHFDKTDTLL